MATPSSGLRRSYNCSALLAGGKFLLCGTDVGDMVVYGCVKKKSGVALHSPCSLIERRTWCQKAARHAPQEMQGFFCGDACWRLTALLSIFVENM